MSSNKIKTDKKADADKNVKTIKTKVLLTPEQLKIFDRLCAEADWVWNEGLKVAFQLHNRKYYDWLDKQLEKQGIDTEGIIKAPIYLSESNAFSGASCRIATCDRTWARDPDNPITYTNKTGKTCKKNGYRLLNGDNNWQRIPPEPFKPVTIAGKELTKLQSLDNVGLLNTVREAQDLPKLTPKSSDWIGGIVGVQGKLTKAWKAYLDVKQKKFSKPKWRGRDIKTDSLMQSQKLKYEPEENEIVVQTFGKIQIAEKDFAKRLKGEVGNSITIIKQPSGFYACIAISESVAEKAKKPTGRIAGIDPGVKNIVVSSNGLFVKPEQTRERLERHILKHQKELSRLYEKRRQRLELPSTKGFKPESLKEKYHAKRIARLQEQMRNSISAFNHKLSTRLTRTHDELAWEDTNFQNMLQQLKDAPIDERENYAKNGRSAKRGLNKSLKRRSIGQLRELTKQKMEALGKRFELSPAPSSSQICHCCGQKGDRRTQSAFYCLNEGCQLFSVEQHADLNAAKNHQSYL
ncbi:transposase [Cyanobacteria bacterium FACHB-63]|nr:transposase [Cyanobacteria bacterium FACHB-63]